MKYTKLILSLVCVSLFTLYSCSDDDNNDRQDVSPEISGIVQSLAANSAADLSWSTQQPMGLYMLQPYAVNVVDNYKNVKYMAAVANNELTATTDEKVYLPNSGNNVDILAYAPWQEMTEPNVISLDVKDQSNPEAIDLLYGFARGVNKYNPNVELDVKHALTHITCRFVVGENSTEEDLKGMKVRVTGLNTKANFNVLTGQLYDGHDVTQIEVPVTFKEDEGYAMSAIMLPVSAVAEDAQLEFYLPATNQAFFKNLADETKELKPSSIYRFDGVVDGTQFELKLVSVTVQEWENGNGPNGEDITVK